MDTSVPHLLRLAGTTLALLVLAAGGVRLIVSARKGGLGAAMVIAALFGFAAVVDPPQQQLVQNSNAGLKRENRTPGKKEDPV